MFYMTESIILKSVMPDDPDMRKKEGEYVRGLIAEGKILSAYRQVGGKGSYMTWDVESNDELQKLLAAFPMAKYLEFTTIPLVPHPSTMHK